MLQDVATLKQVQLDLSEWQNYQPADIPAQHNGCDCGVFGTCLKRLL